MNHSDTLTHSVRGQRHRSSVYRNAMLALANRLPNGRLVVKEHGEVVAESENLDDGLYAEVEVLDPRFYKAALLGGGTGAGEAYIEGWWSSPDMTSVIRVFARNMDFTDDWEARFNWIKRPLDLLTALRNRNTRRGARQNILAHYDLGNDLYESFLDERMQYSSALYLDKRDSLEQAQENKLRRICDQLELGPDDHLLEIGTGWGGLAVFAATNYGCRVTTTTISDAQHKLAGDRIRRAGVEDRVTLLRKDYRDLDGQYDKIVSIEMIEAVGQEYMGNYFEQLDARLKPGGKLLLQAITIAEHRYDRYMRRLDFIRKHIFPGGHLLSLTALKENLALYTSLESCDERDMGRDYAYTIAEWRNRLLAARARLAEAGYDDRFMRLWLYYFGYCEGGFREQHISVVQVTAAGK